MINRVTACLKALIPAELRECLWRLRYMPRHEALGFVREVPPGGLLAALQAYYKDESEGGVSERVAFPLRRLPHPITLRTRTTDLRVYRQVFRNRQYDRLPVYRPRVVVDAGANIGLASLFFLRKYPNARLIAIEPDPENLAIAEENLRPYRDRCTLVRGALWSSRGQLALRRSGDHWSTQVAAEAAPSSPVEAYSLTDLRSMFGLPAIDLLKIDIEGAETEVFRTGGPATLAGVQCCAIELHGTACEDAFTAAAQPHGFRTRTQGEVTVAWRPAPSP